MWNGLANNKSAQATRKHEFIWSRSKCDMIFLRVFQYVCLCRQRNKRKSKLKWNSAMEAFILFLLLCIELISFYNMSSSFFPDGLHLWVEVCASNPKSFGKVFPLFSTSIYMRPSNYYDYKAEVKMMMWWWCLQWRCYTYAPLFKESFHNLQYSFFGEIVVLLHFNNDACIGRKIE